MRPIHLLPAALAIGSMEPAAALTLQANGEATLDWTIVSAIDPATLDEADVPVSVIVEGTATAADFVFVTETAETRA